MRTPCLLSPRHALAADDGFLTKVGKSVYRGRSCIVPNLPAQESRADSSDAYTSRDEYDAERSIVLGTCEPSFFRSISLSSLNARGWVRTSTRVLCRDRADSVLLNWQVMQEQALSRRLIHSTEHSMFWECCEAKLHEPFDNVDLRSQSASCSNKETSLSVARARSSRHLCRVEWFHFVGQYSACGFTDLQDRLIALLSVAQAAQPMLGGHDYFAGLWAHELIRGLI